MPDPYDPFILRFYGDFSTKLKSQKEHSVVFPFDRRKFEETFEVALGDPIQVEIILDSDKVCKVGISDVISIKECPLRYMDALDLKRNVCFEPTHREILLSMKESLDPEIPFNMDSTVTILTFRTRNYDLAPINRYIAGKIDAKQRKHRAAG